MPSAVGKRSKARCLGKGVAVLSRVVRVGFPEEVMFESGPEGAGRKSVGWIPEDRCKTPVAGAF